MTSNNNIQKYTHEQGQEWLERQLELNEYPEHVMKLLYLAADCLDRIADARNDLDVDGLYEVDRFEQKKAHPCVRVELDNKALFDKLTKSLWSYAITRKQEKDELEEKGFANV